MAKGTSKTVPDFALESRILAAGRGPVAGVDEAGRGPLAGPVVAAAVCLEQGAIPVGIRDSKLLLPEVRAALADDIAGVAAIGIGVGDVETIERINILQATLQAMRLAVAALPAPAGYAIVDGNRCPDLACPSEAVVKGDLSSLSIAAASIVAKVHRDRIMCELAMAFPDYGWERNMGYATPEHREAIERVGVTPHHRRSFAPVRAALAAQIAPAQGDPEPA